jgi:hypothetical protein
MKTENLNTQELETLRILLNKMAGTPQPKIYFDPLNKMINDIMDEFNFAQVQYVMNYLNWQWLGKHVTIEMLREEAERLLHGAAEMRLGKYKDEHWEQGIIHGTGGFQAMAFCNEDKTKIIGLNLKFILEEWDAEVDE